MGFFKFYLIMFVGFIAIAMFVGSLDREQPDNLMFAFVMLWLFIFFAKAIHSLTKEYLGLSNSFIDSIKNFSFKRFFSVLMVLVPFALIFIVTPIVLVNYIGGWVFLVIPLLAIGVYIGIERSAKRREHMPMLEHTEAIGFMMFIAYPTILSFVGTLIYYFW